MHGRELDWAAEGQKGDRRIMRYRNQTKVPDELLKPLIRLAAERTGAKTVGLPVTIVRAQGRSCTGRLSAYPGREGVTLRIRLPQPTRQEMHWYKRGDKAREFVLARLAQLDSLALAERFYAVAVHEMQHVADKQAGEFFSHALPYRQRPHEIRASEAAGESYRTRRATEEEAILALGCWLEDCGQRFLQEAKTGE